MIEYLRLEDVIALHRIAAGDHPLLDRDTLAGAVARPQAGFGGQEAHPSVFDKAAALLHGIASTQCFRDGNKRVGWIAAVTFLEVNDLDVRPISDIEAEAFVIAVATSAWTDRTLKKAAEWFEVRTATSMPPRHPQLDWAMLARGGMTDDSLIHLVGGSLAIMAANELPQITSITLACRVFWVPADEGREHLVAAEVVRERDQVVVGAAGWNCVPPVRGGHTHHPHGLMPALVALDLPLLLEEEGRYVIRLRLDADLLTTLPLNVVEAGNLI